METRIRFSRALRGTLLAGSLVLPASPAIGQTTPAPEEIFYTSGALRIQGHLYKPEGAGPFPAVIYNHGSRDGQERTPFPFPYVGRMLTRAGYVVLVAERRGYGKSDGRTWREEAAGNYNALIARLQAETDDVMAAADTLRALPYVDAKRVGIMGWSFGGVVTMMATARGNAFRAAVDQAGGALTWNGIRQMREALVESASKSSTPTLFMVARNDRTTASVTTLADIFDKRGVPHKLIVYESFNPPRPSGSPPGHALFSSQGAEMWERDVVEFFGRHLK